MAFVLFVIFRSRFGGRHVARLGIDVAEDDAGPAAHDIRRSR